jgi:FemAB-related protein (PEP-CTERM system-associated)
MNVEICADPLRWDAYVASVPEASNYHRWRWRDAIEETFGHKAYYFNAVDNGSVTGVLPLVHIKSRIFGQFLVSVPFFSYGGVLANTPDVAASLTAAAEELARQVGVRHIELRQGSELSTAWTSLAPKVTMEVELPGTVQELSDRLSPKMRKRIRFARKNGLEPQWGGPEALANFYPVFATNMRNLGTPVYPRSWFENICRHFPDQIRILTLLEQGKPASFTWLVSQILDMVVVGS